MQTPDLYEYENYFNSAKALLTYKEQEDWKCRYFDDETAYWMKFKMGPLPCTPNPVIDMTYNPAIATKRHFQNLYGFPYRLYSKKCSRNGKQRNWWFIERAADSSQEI